MNISDDYPCLAYQCKGEIPPISKQGSRSHNVQVSLTEVYVDCVNPLQGERKLKYRERG